MKIDKQLPVTTALDPHHRPQTPLPETAARPRPAETNPAEARAPERVPRRESSFNLQLNQQLSSMQSAEHYLSELSNQLAALKLNLSRQLSSPQTANERSSIQQSVQKLNSLLEQRSKLSGNSLDATLKLRLNEPLRSRFSIQGLESIKVMQAKGAETLVFSAGNTLSEPLAVVLEEGMSEEQILRRFNSSLGQAGIRAELDSEGALKFTAPEQDWQKIKEQLRVQGEGKLFAKGVFTPITTIEDSLLGFTSNLKQDSVDELRQLLNSVVASLDRITALREQLSQRQEDVREFLARQENLDEKEWALNFASTVFNPQARKQSHYASISQTIVAQANLTRFAVVSLLA
jgi:hypothetical protein